MVGVSHWEFFGSSKVKRINYDKNKTLQIKLQYYVYVSHGETNTVKIHFPDRANF